jgi:choline transport protein
MPIRALAFTTIITMLLLLIPIGSETAFIAILSLAILALYISYTMPCIFIFLQRLAGEHVENTAWSLGRWGIWINGAASIYGLFIIVFLCFPVTLPVKAENMNWAGPIVGAVVVFSLLDWVIRGRHKFAVPTEKRLDEDYYVPDVRH